MTHFQNDIRTILSSLPACLAEARLIRERRRNISFAGSVQQGSLYPPLHRLEHQGWITADWGASENNRRARFYALTKAGRKQLAVEVSKWERLSAGVNLVLQRT
jgi:DNA-binding PadR family transcriptional regulator